MLANKNPTKELRKKAEKLLSETFPPLNMEKSDVQKLIHELQVHQVELEMQNDELRKAQMDLEESRTKYSDLYDFAPVGYFTFGPSREILDVNLTGAGLLGVEREKLLHRPFSVFVEAKFRSHFYDYCRKLLSGDKTERCELKLVRKDGKSFDGSLQGISARYDNKLSIRCAVSDITELKQAQMELKQLNTQLERGIRQRTAELETANEQLRQEVTERKLAEQALEESERNLAEANRQKEVILQSISDCFYALDKDLRFIYVNSAAEEIWGLSRTDLIGRKIEDVFAGLIDISLSKFRQVLEEKVPQYYEVYSKVAQRWGDMSVYPTQDGISVYFHDITERKRAEEELKRSEEKYRDLIKFAPAGIYEVDFRIPRFTSVNDVLCHYLGYSREELLQMNPSEIMDEKNASLFRERVRRQLNGEKPDDSVEYKVKAKDGREYYAILNITFTYEDGKPKGAMVIAHDITERKRADEALRANQALLNAIMETTPDPVYVKDKESHIIMANPALAKIVGRPLEEILGRTDSEYYGDPSTGEALREHDLRVMNLGKSEVTEETVPTPEGYRTFLSAKTPYRNASGDIIGIAGISRDITQRKRAEEALRESENRFRALVNASSDVVYRMSPDWSEMHQLHGRDFIPDTEEPSRTWLQEYIHPDDQAHVMAVINEAVRTKSTFELEHRVLRVDGSLGWTFSRAIPILDTNGEILEWFGAASDITARKQAEVGLKKARDKLEKEVQERTSELWQAVERLRAENAQRRLLEETLRESEARVRFFASQCLTAQESERKRVAGELHDSIAASLGAMKIRIEKVAEEIKQGHDRSESLQDLESMVSQVNKDVRRIMADLRPSILDDLGIIAAMNWFCREYQKTYSHISVEKQVGISEYEVPDSLKTPIFRISQEALNNIAKHSKATLVNLKLQKVNSGIELTIQDNGQGFDLETARKGMGLSTMRERAQLSGGTFEIESEEGKGTTIRATWTI